MYYYYWPTVYVDRQTAVSAANKASKDCAILDFQVPPLVQRQGYLSDKVLLLFPMSQIKKKQTNKKKGSIPTNYNGGQSISTTGGRRTRRRWEEDTLQTMQ